MKSAKVRAHATLTAATLWSIAAVIALTGSGNRSVFGPLKGADFVYFYTLGHLDPQTASHVLYDPEALHNTQVSLVPDSDPEWYLNVYPPHVVLLFRPLARFSYGIGLVLWSTIVMAAYFACVWLVSGPLRLQLVDWRVLIAAAAAFPAFWFLVLQGQATIILLVSFCLGWGALERGQRFWAGFAFGLIVLKPQFALVLVPLVLFCREWTMLIGASVSIAVQLAATVSYLGFPVLWDYAAVVARYRAIDGLLEPRPAEMHSLATLTNQLPGDWGFSIWAALSIWFIARTIRVWRSRTSVSMRVACLIMASLLVNPHVFVYDATLLALPLIWYAAWVWSRPDEDRLRVAFSWLVYALYLTLLAPTARLVPGLQLSVLVMSVLFVMMTRAASAVPQASAPSNLGSVAVPAVNG